MATLQVFSAICGWGIPAARSCCGDGQGRQADLWRNVPSWSRQSTWAEGVPMAGAKACGKRQRQHCMMWCGVVWCGVGEVGGWVRWWDGACHQAVHGDVAGGALLGLMVSSVVTCSCAALHCASTGMLHTREGAPDAHAHTHAQTHTQTHTHTHKHTHTHTHTQHTHTLCAEERSLAHHGWDERHSSRDHDACPRGHLRWVAERLVGQG